MPDDQKPAEDVPPPRHIVVTPQTGAIFGRDPRTTPDQKDTPQTGR